VGKSAASSLPKNGVKIMLTQVLETVEILPGSSSIFFFELFVIQFVYGLCI
jgi:hypothetical protein